MIVVADEVTQALREGVPVIALESTVFSTLGLPSPHNRRALIAGHNVVRRAGAVPAMTAIIDGTARVGVDERHWDRVLGATTKIAERDLAVAIGNRLAVGVTTVSASLALCAAAGIRVFATGGIGGVHRNAQATGDISADLGAIARHPVITVCAGAKSFLDLAVTLERLETLSVPVLGWRTDDFPAFTALHSGLPVPVRVDSADQVAAIATAARSLGAPGSEGTGLLVAVPPPAPLDPAVAEAATASAEQAADRAGISGPKRTPFILEHIATSTDGASVTANIALVENNTRVATEIATALSR